MTLSTLLLLFGSALLVIAVVLENRRERQPDAAEAKRIGSAFQAGLVAPRVQQVRRDYLAAVHVPSHRGSRRT
jgi:hypothetical protein